MTIPHRGPLTRDNLSRGLTGIGATPRDKLSRGNGPVCQSSLGRHFSFVHRRVMRLSVSGWRRFPHCEAACRVWKPRARQ